MDGRRDRREFLRLAAGAVAAGAFSACSSGQTPPTDEVARTKPATKTLRIAQFSHFVPTYDPWFDEEYARRWGQEHGVDVVVDHISAADIQTRADAEVAGQKGHDIFGLITPSAPFEDEVIDHREIIEEIEARVGKMTPALERAVRNRKTGKYFAVPDFWAAFPVHYRVDLWDGIEAGLAPRSWNDLVRAGPKLKAAGTPLGVGLSSGVDSNINAFALLFSHGASVQDEEGRVVLDRPATLEAVRMATAVVRAGTTDEIFTWDDASDNRFLASGTGSLTLDPVSAIRAVEKQNPELAAKIALSPPPAGSAAGLTPHLTQGYVIWKFARNPEVAKQFLVDLAVSYREAFVRSEFYNLPTYPGAIPDLAGILGNDGTAQPPGKYSILTDATVWTTNIGHPGDTNPAVGEVFTQSVVSRMFAAAARGQMTAEEAVRTAAAEVEAVYAKWRELGKV